MNRKKKPSGNGLITGCDETHEWMLPTWWKHYSKRNSSPVSFIDFGMSKSAKKMVPNKRDPHPLNITLITIKKKGRHLPPLSKILGAHPSRRCVGLPPSMVCQTPLPPRNSLRNNHLDRPRYRNQTKPLPPFFLCFIRICYCAHLRAIHKIFPHCGSLPPR